MCNWWLIFPLAHFNYTKAMPQKEWHKFVNIYTKLAVHYEFYTKMALIPCGIRAYINGGWLVVYVIKEEVRGIMAAKHQRM